MYDLEGSCLTVFSAYSDALGIKSLKWSPSGDLLSVGSYDQVCRVINSMTWQPLLECRHPRTLTGPSTLVVYEEVEDAAEQKKGQGNESRAKYMIASLPVAIPVTDPPTSKPNPKLGVGLLRWSPDCQYLATVNDNMSGTVWIWDLAAGDLAAVLMHLGPLKALEWSPTGTSLALCTGTNRLSLWSPSGASIVHVPLPKFCPSFLHWSDDGQTLVLADKTSFCCAYITAP